MTPTVYNTLFISLAVAIVAAAAVITRHLTATKQARAALSTGREYRVLADEYRRLSDMSITAQEHVDLKLSDLGVRMDDLRDRMEQLERILKEVE
jgi:hypothetical protein